MADEVSIKYLHQSISTHQPCDDDTVQPRPSEDSEKSSYEYEELPTGYIRILKLEPGWGDDPLRCQLLPVSFYPVTSYEAISYVWGDPSNTVAILCDNHQIQVTVNLRDALQSLRSSEKAQTLWADAICINQKDPLEKADQVRLMGEVYWHAKWVNIWLGDKDEDERIGTEVALTFMREFGQIHQKNIQQDGRSRSLSEYEVEELLDHKQEQPRWEAIRRFFDLPWFKRVWVVQEAGLAVNAVFLIGDCIFKPGELAAFVDWIFTTGKSILRYFPIDLLQYRMVLSYSDATRLQSCWEMERVEKTQPDREKQEDFLEVLDKARNLQCTDPRDAIYAFLGHPTALVQGVVDREKKRDYLYDFDKRATIIKPDYTKSLLDLYYEVAIAFLNRYEDPFRVFQYVAHNSTSVEEDFPSWVPRWNISGIRQSFSSDSGILLEASGDLSLLPVQLVKQNVIQLKALPLDVIDFVWGFPEPDSFAIFNNIFVQRYNTVPDRDLNPVEHLWRTFSVRRDAYLQPYLNDIMSFSMTLTSGVSEESGTPSLAETCSERHYEDFCTYRLKKAEIWGPELSDLEREHLEMHNGNADRYLLGVQQASANRAFFCTSEGYIGLGPKIIQETDQCWVPLGSRFPYILRSMDGGGYRMLGNAYIHGVMRGEVVEGLSEGDFQEIEIH